MNISIVLADDHELVRSGIRRLLEYNNGFCVIGEAGNGNEAVQLVRALRPDVAVLDISMPLMGGIEAARSIHKQSPNTGIIILSMYYDEGHVIDALRAGALGYVIKASAGSEFFDAVHTVASHRLFLSPQVSAKVPYCCTSLARASVKSYNWWLKVTPAPKSAPSLACLAPRSIPTAAG
jgi:DNA-binding NarL/FixJ family response regulator